MLISRRLGILSLALYVTTAGALLQAAAVDARKLLAAAKTATGGSAWDRISSWHERGTFKIGDLRGTYEFWLDPKHGWWRLEQLGSGPNSGDFQSLSGWNGKVSWTADHTGDVVPLESAKAVIDAKGIAYREAFGFFRNPAMLTVREEGALDVITISPKGLDPFEISIDRKTHLIVRQAEITGIDRTADQNSDFREVEGLLVPFTKINDVVTSKTESLETRGDFGEGLFDPPLAHLSPLVFPEGKDSITFDFRFEAGALYIPASINGIPQKDFVLDTGASITISPKTIAALGLKTDAAGKSYGQGMDSSPERKARLRTIDIAGMRLDGMIVGVTDLPESDTNPVEGILGYEVARRAVITVDYKSQKMTFTKLEAFHPPAAAKAIPFRFADPTEVLIPGAVDGIKGDFQIDTGADSGLVLNRPFSEKNGFLTRYGKGPRGEVAGIGGKASVIAFRPKKFELGTLERMPIPEGLIQLATSGGAVEENIAGLIGNDLLQGYRVTFDYSRRMVYFEGDGIVEKPVQITIGVLKRNSAGEAEVTSVVQGSSLQVGDVILKFGGRPLPEGWTPGEWSVEKGRPIKLEIRRAGATQEVIVR